MLTEHEIVEPTEDDYGAEYRLTDEAIERRSTLDDVFETVD